MRPPKPLAEIYACFHAREFPLQALLRSAGKAGLQPKPIAVLEGEPPFEQVCSLNRQALTLGMVRGMMRTEAELFPEAMLLTRSGPEECAAKDALFECVSRFSPRLEDQSNDGSFTVVLDITGTEKLFGEPRHLGKKLLQSIHALGIRGSVGISSNFHAAICLARGMGGSSGVLAIPPGMEPAALAPLSLSVLDLTLENAATFSSWGIATLGELAKLSETELIARLGQEGKRLWQMARGEVPHLFRPQEAVLPLAEFVELDSPVEVFTSLLFILATMLDQLIARAQSNLLVLASVTLDCQLEGGSTHTRTVRPALASNDRMLWLKLLDLDLQAHSPNAPVLSLRLRAVPGDSSRVQLGLFCPQSPEPMRLDVTLRRICAIVGKDGVGRAVLKDTHSPDAFSMEPFVAPAPTASLPSASSDACQSAPRIALRQIRPAEEIAVEPRNRLPGSFVFREKRYTVNRAYGPWFSGGDWWKETLWSVEQWDIVARAQDGCVLCCCLTHDLADDCWRMEALYD